MLGYAHVDLRGGVPYLTGTQIKVIEVALDRLAYGWDADEIQRQHPHLSLGQVHSALAYYYDHRDELDRDIAERKRRVDELRKQHNQTGLRAELVARLPSGE